LHFAPVRAVQPRWVAGSSEPGATRAGRCSRRRDWWRGRRVLGRRILGRRILGARTTVRATSGCSHAEHPHKSNSANSRYHLAPGVGVDSIHLSSS